MDGLLTDDILSSPLVLPSPILDQPINLISCDGWQFTVTKDQPLVILDSAELSLQNVADYPLHFSHDITANEFTFPQSEGTTGPFLKGQDSASYSINLLNLRAVEVQNKNGLSGSQQSHETQASNTEKDPLNSYLVEDLVETFIIYKCKLCPFKTREKTLLSKHIGFTHLKVSVKENLKLDNTEKIEKTSETDSSQERLIYMCGNCSEAFDTFSDCRVHMAQNHKIMMGSKPLAKQSVKNKEQGLFISKENEEKDTIEERNLVVVENPKERTLRCSSAGCVVKFATKQGLLQHEACHSTTEPRQYLCPYCTTSFTNWSMCANHLWSKHATDVELYSCRVCKYKTATKVKMSTHEGIHTAGKDFKCGDCGKMFNQRTQLRNHQVIHMKSQPSMQPPTWYTKKICQECGKTFANGKSVKKHIEAVHRKLRPHVCWLCGYSSATKGMLQTHLRLHTGEKPFSCPSCSYTTGDHNSLRRHRMRHSGVRPYSCRHCSYSSIQSRSLKHHLKTCHPSSPGVFSCSDCSYTTLTSKALNQHIASEHPGKKEVSEKAVVLEVTRQQFEDYKGEQNLQNLIPFTTTFNISPLQVSEKSTDQKLCAFNSESIASSNDCIPLIQNDANEVVIEIPISQEEMSYFQNCPPQHYRDDNVQRNV